MTKESRQRNVEDVTVHQEILKPLKQVQGQNDTPSLSLPLVKGEGWVGVLSCRTCFNISNGFIYFAGERLLKNCRCYALLCIVGMFLAMGWQISFAQEEESQCIQCHMKEKDEDMKRPVDEWRKSYHAEEHNSCDGCHGGNPMEVDKDGGHTEKLAFIGSPEEEDIPDMCGICHETIRNDFYKGSHGKALEEGESVAVCTTCHDSHNVQRASIDQIISVPNCEDCHEEEEYQQIKENLSSLRIAVDTAQSYNDRVRAMGMETFLLEKRLSSANATISKAAHRMSKKAIRKDFAKVSTEVQEIYKSLSLMEKEAMRRRYVGFGIIAFLLINIGLMIPYRNSFH